MTLPSGPSEENYKKETTQGGCWLLVVGVGCWCWLLVLVLVVGVRRERPYPTLKFKTLAGIILE